LLLLAPTAAASSAPLFRLALLQLDITGFNVLLRYLSASDADARKAW
jgi:hypothetical protein